MRGGNAMSESSLSPPNQECLWTVIRYVAAKSLRSMGFLARGQRTGEKTVAVNPCNSRRWRQPSQPPPSASTSTTHAPIQTWSSYCVRRLCTMAAFSGGCHETKVTLLLGVQFLFKAILLPGETHRFGYDHSDPPKRSKESTCCLVQEAGL